MGSNLSLSIKMLQSMMTALGLDESNFGSIYQDAMGRNKPCFRRKKSPVVLRVLTGWVFN